MSSPNASILERNICHGLDSDEADSMFFGLVDRHGPLVAERAAYRWRDVRGSLEPMLALAASPFERIAPDVAADVEAFITRRFHHMAQA